MNCSSVTVNAVDSDVRGPTTGVQRRGTTGRHAQSDLACGSAATAAASARLTRRRGVLLQACHGGVSSRAAFWHSLAPHWARSQQAPSHGAFFEMFQHL